MHILNRYTKILLLAGLPLFAGCHKNDQPAAKEDNQWPYSQYMQTDYGSYIEIPDDAALNPTDEITVEGWVRLDNTGGGNILFYKKLYYEEGGYFVDVRERDGKTRLYSYLGSSGSTQKAGNFTIHQWTHFAVTSDGHVRKHYINGEFAGEFTETGGIFTPCSAPLIIAKTVPANTGLAEFRLWNTARTQAEIKKTMNKDIDSPMPGLIAVWSFEENAKDIIGGHDGTLHNHPRFLIWDQ